jgi:hypothetical protein
VKLKQAQVLDALAEYLVRHKLVRPGSAVDIRLKVVDGKGKPVGILLQGNDSDPQFVAEVTDFGVPTPD